MNDVHTIKKYDDSYNNVCVFHKLVLPVRIVLNTVKNIFNCLLMR